MFSFFHNALYLSKTTPAFHVRITIQMIFQTIFSCISFYKIVQVCSFYRIFRPFIHFPSSPDRYSSFSSIFKSFYSLKNTTSCKLFSKKLFLCDLFHNPYFFCCIYLLLRIPCQITHFLACDGSQLGFILQIPKCRANIFDT